MLSDQDQLVLDGYDIVSYYSHNLKMGNPDIKSIFKNNSYQFCNEGHKKAFELTPNKFIPQYHGYCAMAMSEGQKIKTIPTEYAVYDSKLYLFCIDHSKSLKSMWEKSKVERIKSANRIWKNKQYY